MVELDSEDHLIWLTTAMDPLIEEIRHFIEVEPSAGHAGGNGAQSLGTLSPSKDPAEAIASPRGQPGFQIL